MLIANPSGIRDHDGQTQWVLEILIARPSGFWDHIRQTQWVLEILIAKPSPSFNSMHVLRPPSTT